jgi:hypothetical protein
MQDNTGCTDFGPCLDAMEGAMFGRASFMTGRSS